jgi:hypothetical protein
MSVDSSPVKFTPALPSQPVPEIATISGGRPVFRAELPDGRVFSGMTKAPETRPQTAGAATATVRLTH